MNRFRWIFAVILSVVSSIALADTNISVFFGQKELNNGDWGVGSYLGAGLPLDRQDEFGILTNFGVPNSSLNVAVDLLGSSSESNFDSAYGPGRNTTSTSELDVGVRQLFDIVGTALHPYIGGGLAFVSANYEDRFYYYYASDTDNDSGLGYWVNGGIYWSLEPFLIGFDARYSQADVILLGQSVDAGGFHGGLTLGFGW